LTHARSSPAGTRISLPASGLPGATIAGHDQVADLQRTAGNLAVTDWLTTSGALGQSTSAARAAGARRKDPARAPVAQRLPAVQRDEEDQTPEDEFLDDLDTGVAKAKEYLEYIPSALEWWNQGGGEMPAGLTSAADNLARISTRITDGLDKFSDVVDKAKQALQIKRWAESVLEVADATRSLELGDKASRDAWISAVDRLGKRSGPFIDAAKSWLKSLAVRGGVAASRAFIVLQGVTAYAEIGWALLKAGVRNVEAYTDRFGYDGTEMRKIEAAERGETRPPEPDYPGNWTTAAERRAQRRAIRRSMELAEKERKRQERLKPFATKVEHARQRVADAKRRFDDKGFAPRYRRRRAKLLYQVGHEMRYGKRDLTLTGGWLGERTARIERGVGARWWEVFVDSDVTTQTGEGDFGIDPVSGRAPSEKKERITLEEAQQEIEGFAHVRPTCLFYDDIYAKELERYTAKESKALKAANDEYATAATAKAD
jgi:hypothetical protein